MTGKIFPMEKQGGAAVDPILEEPAEERDFDSFFLHHLQSVKASDAWYLNQHFIGKGGNGTTFFVTCTSGTKLGVQFALKVFHKISDAKRRERFLSEVQHYKVLSHPSIIKFYDEGTYTVKDKVTGKIVREYPFTVVDYMPTNLQGKLERGRLKITRLEAVRYIFNIAAGVAYLHSRPEPIVHRDIKPANILISDHQARLGDLGLARVLMSDDKGNDSEDVAAYIAMPRFYRTPELVKLARGEKVKLTVASDIYQLGLVLYQSVTGFNPLVPTKNVREDIQLNIRPIQGICGAVLYALISEMLREAPEQRPGATEVLARLGATHKDICTADFDATGMMR